MSQFEKLVERIRARPPEADFSDVMKVLENFGRARARRRESHVTFSKAGETPIVVPLVGGRKVRRRYLDMICERLGLDDRA
jgi:predicted RNA binding protein YcfA (HicA-like mRNA interferase family)